MREGLHGPTTSVFCQLPPPVRLTEDRGQTALRISRCSGSSSGPASRHRPADALLMTFRHSDGLAAAPAAAKAGISIATGYRLARGRSSDAGAGVPILW